MPLANAAPLFPRLHLKTKNQHMGIWSNAVNPELSIIGTTILWVCRNLNWHWRNAQAKREGIINQAYATSSADISGSCPKNARICPALAHIHARGIQANCRTNVTWLSVCVSQPYGTVLLHRIDRRKSLVWIPFQPIGKKQNLKNLKINIIFKNENTNQSS